MSGAADIAAPPREAGLLARIASHAARLPLVPVPVVEGRLTRMVGLTLEAVGCQAAIGDRCEVRPTHGNAMEAEVVGFAGERLFLMPVGEMHGLEPAARVVPVRRAGVVPVGEEMLGRIVDGSGVPLDELGPLRCSATARLAGQPINPLQRQPIHEPLDVGVRAINSLLTIGRGQRVGLFAGSGVGKSVLLG
jgi:flagellum-specific ATP synthase